MLDNDGPGKVNLASLRRQDGIEDNGGGQSQASSFSDAFGWANFQFGDIFAFAEKSCAAIFLGKFWATVGTFISSIAFSYLTREGVMMLVKKIASLITGLRPPGIISCLLHLPTFTPKPSSNSLSSAQTQCLDLDSGSTSST